MLDSGPHATCNHSSCGRDSDSDRTEAQLGDVIPLPEMTHFFIFASDSKRDTTLSCQIAVLPS